MLTTSFALSTGAGSAPIRRSLAQSTATSTRSSASTGSSRRSPSRSRKRYSAASGALPARNITASLPRAPRLSAVASSEPSASPSGFSWVTTVKRSFPRRAFTTACRSVVFCEAVIFGQLRGELLDQRRHADPPLDRLIVGERKRRRPSQGELAVDLRLQDAVRRLEARERLAALAVASEHRHEDPRLAEVGRHVHRRHGHEADPRVLEVAESFRDDRPDRLVHPAHALGHGRRLVTARNPNIRFTSLVHQRE